MNERIQKIAEKTDVWCKEYYFGQDPNNIDWEKKFAELIVQECANIVRNSSLPDSYSEDCLKYIADELEEHFGVEP